MVYYAPLFSPNDVLNLFISISLIDNTYPPAWSSCRGFGTTYLSLEGIIMINKLWRKAFLSAAAGLLISQSAVTQAARCEYVVQSEWGSGFVAAVKITNDTTTPINGWSVNWAYTDGSKRTGGWNANFSGSNPYSATNVGWNAKINPGQTAEFGIQGNKGVANGPAAKPVVSGAVCANQISSASSIRSSSSSVSSSLVKSSSISIPKFSSSNTFSSARSNAGASSASLSSSSRNFSSSSSVPPSSNGFHSASSFSVGSNLPEIDLQVSVHGMTVHVDTSGSVDVDGDKLYYTVSFGDDSWRIDYSNVWHTYREPGTYLIEVRVSDVAYIFSRYSIKTYAVTVEASEGNQAPIARLAGVRENQSIIAKATASFDPEGSPLTYEWDFGDGSYVGDAHSSIRDCESGDTLPRYRKVVLTVSDGELKNTVLGQMGGDCGVIYDAMPTARFSYKVDGNKMIVDGSQSEQDTAFRWNFGDGSTGSGLIATHTYAAPGIYDVRLVVDGPSMFSHYSYWLVEIGGSSSSSSMSSSSSIQASSSSIQCSQSSFQSSSSSIQSAPNSMRSSSSSIQLLPSSIQSSFSSIRSSSAMSCSSSSQVSSSASSLRSSSSQESNSRNHYTAPRATTAPVIDGVVDGVWDRASWAPIDVFWLGTQSNPSAQDYSGRYKALWDENYLYVLYDITDDRIYDGARDALARYWEDDTVELFIDENRDGFPHLYNTHAWTYHISTYGDVVDSTTYRAKLLNDHIDSRLVSNGTQHYWEMRIRIFGADYDDEKANVPLQLYTGKLMGFSACYIDNDGSPQRESMMGSVDTQGHKDNLGYLDASVFGSMLLVE
jgi:hypothetical protein